MRLGSDRHELGDVVFGMLFPDGVARVRGARVGEPLDALVAREGAPARSEGNQVSWALPVEDPAGHGRALHLWGTRIQDKVVTLQARLVSRNRIDIDAAWRPVKDHLDARHGAPAKQVTGVLKLVWTVAGEPHPTVISGCRFRLDDGSHVLDLVQTLADGASIRVGGPSGRRSPPAGGRPPPRAPGSPAELDRRVTDEREGRTTDALDDEV